MMTSEPLTENGYALFKSSQTAPPVTRPSYSNRAIRRQSLTVLLVMLCGSLFVDTSYGQTPDISVASADIGINGTYKLGFWIPLRVELAGVSAEEGKLELLCPDGDGTDAWYDLFVDQDPDGSQEETTSNEKQVTYRGLFRVGRLGSEFRLRWTSASGSDVWEESLINHVDVDGLLSTSELYVVLGDGKIVREALTRSRAADLDRKQIEITDPSLLPVGWLGWSCVDRLVIPSGKGELASKLSSRQVDAIEQWVKQGGSLVYSMGIAAPDVFSDPNRIETRMLPGEFNKVVEHPSSAGFETYAIANSQLLAVRGESISISQLSAVEGEIEAFEGRFDRDLPLVIRNPMGLGRVVFLAFDLYGERFANWDGRNRFLIKAFGEDREPGTRPEGEARGGQVSHLGYEDLAGQLRSSLDQFKSVQFVNFTWVAILIVLFILCIGPGDYFFLKRVVGRMEWTWVTFTLVVVVFCGIAIWAVGATKGTDIRCNQVEVIDIDFKSQEVRGGLWSTIYSPQSSRFSLDYEKVDQQSPISINGQVLGWEGLPGSGIGGMDSAISAKVIGKPYASNWKKDNGQLANSLDSVPLQVASTKMFFGRWKGELNGEPSSRLELDSRSDSLAGQITNPLNVKLTNVVVLYGSWAYVVERDIEPGETIDIELDTTERTLEGYLTRRQVVDGRDMTTPWDPAEKNMQRIVEMMLFYESAGGENYTQLSQRLHAEFDLSDHLMEERALLLGQASDSLMQMKLGESKGAELYDNRWTFYRFVLPVVDPFQRSEP